ncbi:hypothetical protein AGMMS50229_03370 [Campylobacterota bacterium]|nr:hypothetical protein AGMMS50229_03370 [Campylobacterota bacterium]
MEAIGSTFFEAVVTIVDQIIGIYIWVIIIAAIVSWVRPDPFNPFVQVLWRLTEPVYAQIRRLFPTVFAGIDFAPIIVILVLQFVKLFLVKLLYQLI